MAYHDIPVRDSRRILMVHNRLPSLLRRRLSHISALHCSLTGPTNKPAEYQTSTCTCPSRCALWRGQVHNLEGAFPFQGISVLVCVPEPPQCLHVLRMHLRHDPACQAPPDPVNSRLCTVQGVEGCVCSRRSVNATLSACSSCKSPATVSRSIPREGRALLRQVAHLLPSSL